MDFQENLDCVAILVPIIRNSNIAVQDRRAVDPARFPSRSFYTVPRTWQEYLVAVAAANQNYLGLLNPFYRGCDPCTYHYDAIIRMETFEQDVR